MRNEMQIVEGERGEAGLLSLVLGIASAAVVFWTLHAFLASCSEVPYAENVLGRNLGFLCFLGALIYLAHFRRVESEKGLFACSLIGLMFPVLSLASITMPSATSLFWLFGCACLGVGQACLVSLWAGCVSFLLGNRETGRVIIVAACAAVVSFAFVSPVETTPIACSLMIISFAIAWFLLFGLYLLSEKKDFDLVEAGASDGSASSPDALKGPSAPVFVYIAMQGLIYGVFYAVLLKVGGSCVQFAMLGAFFGILVAGYLEFTGKRLSLSPRFGQRVLTLLIILGLISCSMGADLLMLDEATMIGQAFLSAAVAFFLLTSFLLFMTETREFGFSPIRYVSLGRIPVWSGVIVGFAIGSALCSFTPSANYIAITADFLIIVHVIVISAHHPVDPIDIDATGKLISRQGVEGDSEGSIKADFEAKESDGFPEKSTGKYSGNFKLAAALLATELYLTPRQQEVYELLLKGRSVRFISETLFIAEATAKTHIANIYRKFEVNSKQELISKVERRAVALLEQRKTLDDDSGGAD